MTIFSYKNRNVSTDEFKGKSILDAFSGLTKRLNLPQDTTETRAKVDGQIISSSSRFQIKNIKRIWFIPVSELEPSER